MDKLIARKQFVDKLIAQMQFVDIPLLQSILFKQFAVEQIIEY